MRCGIICGALARWWGVSPVGAGGQNIQARVWNKVKGPAGSRRGPVMTGGGVNRTEGAKLVKRRNVLLLHGWPRFHAQGLVNGGCAGARENDDPEGCDLGRGDGL